LVSFLFAVLLLTVPRAQLFQFVKVGGTCPSCPKESAPLAGASPRPRWKSLQGSSGLLAGLRGLTSKEGDKEMRKEDGEEGKRRDHPTHTKIPVSAHVNRNVTKTSSI